MRVAVLGAGIVGVHIAAELARRGAEVTLVDRGEPGSGTSGASFAWIDASHPSLASYLELRVQGVRAWGQARERLGAPPWLHLGGTLAWAHAPEGLERLEAHARMLEALGRPVARLSPGQARAREPDLSIPPATDVVYGFPGEGWVHTRPAIAALLERGRAAGLRVTTGEEVRELLLDGAGRRVTGVMLGSGARLRCDVVVSCTGRWTQELVRGAGIEVPMISPEPEGSPAVGLVVTVAGTGCRLGCVAFADGVMLRPDGDGRLTLHSDGHDARVRYGRPAAAPLVEELVAVLRESVRGAQAAQVAQARVCVRALPADGLPVVGPARDGLYVVATHSGVTLAPALAELVAGELIARRELPELARFRPGRFERAAAGGVGQPASPAATRTEASETTGGAPLAATGGSA